MKRASLILIFLVGISTSTFSQFNHVFLEIGGSGLYGSLNWERTLFERKNLLFGGRIGLSTLHIKDHNNKFNPDLIIPFGQHLLVGKGHHAEIGIGNTLTSMTSNSPLGQSERQTRMHGTAFLGYRYQNDRFGYVLRAGYSPIFENYSKLYHWGAISIGYRF